MQMSLKCVCACGCIGGLRFAAEICGSNIAAGGESRCEPAADALAPLARLAELSLPSKYPHPLPDFSIGELLRGGQSPAGFAAAR